MAEMRSSNRKKKSITTFIRKEMAGGGHTLMQFISMNLSEGGIFISTEDLSLFDLGEELGVIVRKETDRLYEGRAKVVRSARVFESEEAITESGFGLMFLQQEQEFKKAIADCLEDVSR